MSPRPRIRAALLAALLAIVAALAAAPGASAAITLPANFEDQTVYSGINQPTLIRFAPDGRVFVGEKGGQILVYDNLDDKTPEVFANLAKPVYDNEDHGLLGLALDPGFDVGRPYVYALYSFNHELANKEVQKPLVTDPKALAPRWPSKKPAPVYEEEECPELAEVGCEVSGLLVKLTAEPGTDHAVPSAAAPNEKVLLEGWCQQSTTHSIGDLGFGPEGDLYVSGGEGAMFSEPDIGQFGNPCKDPVEETVPFEPPSHLATVNRETTLGGSLRSQSLLRNHAEAKHATLLSGSVLRVDPDTGEGVPGNPKFANGAGEPNAERIVGIGFRQPWRFAFNNRTGHLFVDNVGNGAYEEMERLSLGAASVYNGGWPCYEGGPGGPRKNLEYAGEFEPRVGYCKGQYKKEEEGNPQTAAPFYAYEHSGPAVPGDACLNTHTDIAGLAFYESSAYPAEYKNALFFSDALRGCIYVMKAGANGEPIASSATNFLANSEKFSFPGVDVQQGPEGNIFYTQLFGAGSGTVHRIVYNAPPVPPTPPLPVNPQPPVTPPAPAPTPAQPKIKQRPAKSTESTTAKFVFSGEAGMRFRCKIDGKSFGSCHSPRTYKHLKPGQHQFRVYALDSSGNRGKATIFKWKIVKPS